MRPFADEFVMVCPSNVLMEMPGTDLPTERFAAQALLKVSKIMLKNIIKRFIR